MIEKRDIQKVEKLFKEKIEFDSKTSLRYELNSNMKISVLAEILNKLITENKVIEDGDGSLTWVFAENNEKLKQSWAKGIPI